MAKKKLSKKKRRIRLIRRIILLTILLAIAIGLLVFSPKIIKIIGLAQEAKSLVSKSTADTFRESGTTVIYDTDGNELCTMRESKDMYYVEMDNIPDTLAQAFIVMEDKDFYSHKGIDFKAIIRAIIANTENDEIVQGASTITQQLAKNIFLSQDVTWERKVKEMIVAIDLEKKYSKDDATATFATEFDAIIGDSGFETSGCTVTGTAAGGITITYKADTSKTSSGAIQSDNSIKWTDSY